MSRTWPEAVTTEWVDEREVRESGLLAHINRAVLWPLGMALTVFINDGEYEPRLRIQRNQPFDPIVGDGGGAAATEAQMRTFAEWAATRLAALPPRDALDVERLDAALSALTEGDLYYDHRYSSGGEPMDPELFVHYEHLRKKVAAQSKEPTHDPEVKP